MGKTKRVQHDSYHITLGSRSNLDPITMLACSEVVSVLNRRRGVSCTDMLLEWPGVTEFYRVFNGSRRRSGQWRWCWWWWRECCWRWAADSAVGRLDYCYCRCCCCSLAVAAVAATGLPPRRNRSVATPATGWPPDRPRSWWGRRWLAPATGWKPVPNSFYSHDLSIFSGCSRHFLRVSLVKPTLCWSWAIGTLFSPFCTEFLIRFFFYLKADFRIGA